MGEVQVPAKADGMSKLDAARQSERAARYSLVENGHNIDTKKGIENYFELNTALIKQYAGRVFEYAGVRYSVIAATL